MRERKPESPISPTRFRLGDVCEIVYGERIRKIDSIADDYPVYGGGGETFRWATYNRENACVVSRFAMSKECVRYVQGRFFLNDSGLTVESKDSGLLQEFLNWFLHGKQDEIYSLGQGAAQRNLNVKRFVGLLIPRPPLAEQRLIASHLDKVTNLISLRKQQLVKLDELVKSRFVEMFGDTFSNPKQWSSKTFQEAGNRLSDGPFGSNLKSSHYSDSGVRVIRLGNIGVGKFIDDDRAFIPYDHYEKLKKYTCRAGEIVIGTLGDPNLRACLVPPSIEIAVNKSDCVHYLPREDLLDKQYVCWFLNAPGTLRLAASMIHGQTRSRVSSGQIAKMPIRIPPHSLQCEFAAFVEKVDKLKVKVQKSLEELKTLKKALMQQYFG